MPDDFEWFKIDILYHLSFAHYLSGNYEEAIDVCIQTINNYDFLALFQWINYAIAYHKEENLRKAYQNGQRSNKIPSQDLLSYSQERADDLRQIIEDSKYHPFIKKIFPKLNEEIQLSIIHQLFISYMVVGMDDSLFSILNLDRKTVEKYFATLRKKNYITDLED